MTGVEVAQILAEEWAEHLKDEKLLRDLSEEIADLLLKEEYMSALKKVIEVCAKESIPITRSYSVFDTIHRAIMSNKAASKTHGLTCMCLGVRPIVLKDEFTPLEDEISSDEVTEFIVEGLKGIWRSDLGITVIDYETYEGAREARFYTSTEALKERVFREHMEKIQIWSVHEDHTKNCDLFVIPLSDGQWWAISFKRGER